MTISMHAASIPVLKHQLETVLTWLDTAEEHAKAKNFDTAILVNARLAPDMFPLSRQIQIATDQAKFCAARLSGQEAPKFEDTETTFDELRERIRKTVDFIANIPASEIDGSEDKDIKLKAGPRELEFKGQFYLTNWVLPNFYFHVTTTYALLRQNGVALGKADFLNLS